MVSKWPRGIGVEITSGFIQPDTTFDDKDGKT